MIAAVIGFLAAVIGSVAAVIGISVAVIGFSEPPFGLWAGGTRGARDPNGPRGYPLWRAQGLGPWAHRDANRPYP